MVAESIEFIFIQAREKGFSESFVKLEIENLEPQTQGCLDVYPCAGKAHAIGTVKARAVRPKRCDGFATLRRRAHN